MSALHLGTLWGPMALATLPLLWLGVAMRRRRAAPGKMRMIVSALAGLSMGFAGWAMCVYGYVIVPTLKDDSIEARLAHEVPFVLSLAIFTGLAAFVLSFALPRFRCERDLQEDPDEATAD